MRTFSNGKNRVFRTLCTKGHSATIGHFATSQHHNSTYTDPLHIPCRKGIWKENTPTTDRIRNSHVSRPDKQRGIFEPWISIRLKAQQNKLHLMYKLLFVEEFSETPWYSGLQTMLFQCADRIWFPQRSTQIRVEWMGAYHWCVSETIPSHLAMPSEYFAIAQNPQWRIVTDVQVTVECSHRNWILWTHMPKKRCICQDRVELLYRLGLCLVKYKSEVQELGLSWIFFYRRLVPSIFLPLSASDIFSYKQ